MNTIASPESRTSRPQPGVIENPNGGSVQTEQMS